VPKPIEISDLERTLKRVLPASVIVYKNEPRKKNRKENVENKELKATTEIGDIKEDNERIENKEINAKKASFLDVLKEMGVDTDYGLDYCGQDEDFYKELLDDYADNRDGKLAEIKGYFDAHDLKNYEVRVHGIKSTSKLIGALSLSDEAKALEDAAKTEDEGYISEHHPAFIIKYEALMNAISEGGAE
jgi:HPt (histidine-containing phosphotransfer) domain-containing protein